MSSSSHLSEHVFGGSGVFHNILSYLSVKDVFQSYTSLNRQSFKQVKKHYLFYQIPRSKVYQGCLSGIDQDVVSVLLQYILLISMLTQAEAIHRNFKPPPIGQSDITAFPFLQPLVEGMILYPSLNCFELLEQHATNIPQLMTHALKYWTTSMVDVDKGIVDQAISALKEAEVTHDEDGELALDPDMRERLLKTMVDDIQHWAHNRLTDTFIVLFDREDGRILVSQDLQRVYHVVDIVREPDRKPVRALPVHVREVKKMTQIIEHQQQPEDIAIEDEDNIEEQQANNNNDVVEPGNTKLDIHFMAIDEGKDEDKSESQTMDAHDSNHSVNDSMTDNKKSIFGKYSLSQGYIVKCTLFPYQNQLILTTRHTLSYTCEPVTNAHIREALKAYIKAEDEGTIITTLPCESRLSKQPKHIVMLVEEAYHCREDFEDWLDDLKSMPINTEHDAIGEIENWGFGEIRGYQMIPANIEEGRYTPELHPTRNIHFYYRQSIPEGSELRPIHVLRTETQKEIDSMYKDIGLIDKFLHSIVACAYYHGHLPTTLTLLSDIEACKVLAKVLQDDPYLSQIRILWDVIEISEVYDTNVTEIVEIYPRCYECRCLTTPQGKSVYPCTECYGRCVSFYCCNEHRHECTMGSEEVPQWRRSSSGTVDMAIVSNAAMMLASSNADDYDGEEEDEGEEDGVSEEEEDEDGEYDEFELDDDDDDDGYEEDSE